MLRMSKLLLAGRCMHVLAVVSDSQGAEPGSVRVQKRFRDRQKAKLADSQARIEELEMQLEAAQGTGQPASPAEAQDKTRPASATEVSTRSRACLGSGAAWQRRRTKPGCYLHSRSVSCQSRLTACRGIVCTQGSGTTQAGTRGGVLGGNMTLTISVGGAQQARALPIDEVAAWSWQQLGQLWKARPAC